jgi:hypothetical protein
MPFIALILLCSASISAEDCSKENAIDYMSFGATNELTCLQKSEDAVIYFAHEDYGLGDGYYIVRSCTRNKTGEK